MEYAALVWNTASADFEHYVEQVQRRFTKHIHELDQQPYPRRPELFRLDSLATRGKQKD